MRDQRLKARVSFLSNRAVFKMLKRKGLGILCGKTRWIALIPNSR